MNTKDYSPIKAGLKKGFGLPGVGMGSAMLGFGALAYETNLDIYVGLLQAHLEEERLKENQQRANG